MFALLKTLCAMVYLLALASLFGTLPFGFGGLVQFLSIAMVCVHAVEALFVHKYLRTYPGSLALSWILALLFGLLHWMPLIKARQTAPSPPTP